MRNSFERGLFLAAALVTAGCNSKPEKNDGMYPQCGPGITIKAEQGEPWISSPLNTSQWAENCAFDSYFQRDCSGIRATGHERIAAIMSLFKCEDHKAIFKVEPSVLENLTNFADIPHMGNCNDVAKEYGSRVRRVIERVACDKDGQPYEKLKLGDNPGGRQASPYICVSGRPC